ncbi:MAG: hypothetical protein RL689_105, partial [Planctomycetota bacterium]
AQGAGGWIADILPPGPFREDDSP